MKGLAIERGVEVQARGSRYVITHVLDFETVMAQELSTRSMERLAITELSVPPPSESTVAVPDLSVLDGHDWDEARRRQRVIRALLELPRRRAVDVEAAASELGVDRATIFRWLSAYRSTGKLSSLLPHRPSGGRGKGRLEPEVETIIKVAIETYYLTKQQPSIKSTAHEVARLCRVAGLKAPHANTIRSRVLALAQDIRTRRRGNAKKAADLYNPRPGTFEDARHPLAVVQIDHTKLDIVLVDSLERKPIGRPWITLAFDVFSRMVIGFYISLDPPSASTTGLCLANAVLPKETWLAKRNIANNWPCWGMPVKIHLDNAREFRGEMVRRACEQYGIILDFRPVATPHFGGHIERMLGTLARALHELPGTTFSNTKQRGDYDSDKEAAMTIDELEQWVGEYITGVYHRKMHSGIKQAPIMKWTDAILGTPQHVGIGMPARPTDEERVRLDFMPLVERTIQPYGVRIDDIHYYSDVLRPYINTSGRTRRGFTFRRDPRDISAVYFWDPELKQYNTIPYRNLAHPAISVWELREVRKRLEEAGRADIDEDAIFESYERLRAQREQAVSATKRVRRLRERRTAVKRLPPPSRLAPEPVVMHIETPKAIAPFEIDDA